MIKKYANLCFYIILIILICTSCGTEIKSAEKCLNILNESIDNLDNFEGEFSVDTIIDFDRVVKFKSKNKEIKGRVISKVESKGIYDKNRNYKVETTFLKNNVNSEENFKIDRVDEQIKIDATEYYITDKNNDNKVYKTDCSNYNTNIKNIKDIKLMIEQFMKRKDIQSEYDFLIKDESTGLYKLEITMDKSKLDNKIKDDDLSSSEEDNLEMLYNNPYINYNSNKIYIFLNDKNQVVKTYIELNTTVLPQKDLPVTESGNMKIITESEFYYSNVDYDFQKEKERLEKMIANQNKS